MIKYYAGDAIVGDVTDTKPLNVEDGARFYETGATPAIYIKKNDVWVWIASGDGAGGPGTSGYSGFSGSPGTGAQYWTRTGTLTWLTNLSDKAGIGLSNPNNKLHIHETSPYTGDNTTQKHAVLSNYDVNTNDSGAINYVGDSSVINRYGTGVNVSSVNYAAYSHLYSGKNSNASV